MVVKLHKVKFVLSNYLQNGGLVLKKENFWPKKLAVDKFFI